MSQTGQAPSGGGAGKDSLDGGIDGAGGRLVGGDGDDELDAEDGEEDVGINGGQGEDSCQVDPVDPRSFNCES